MTVKTDISTLIGSRIAEAWPGTTLTTDATPLAGGFWASMYSLGVAGQPAGVPAKVVFRIAPDAAMGAKEIAVQQTVAELGFPTPHVRLNRPADDELGAWSVMDFAAGTPPLGDLNGIAALRKARDLWTRLPGQLAEAMAELHTLDPTTVTLAVKSGASAVAWTIHDLLVHFEAHAGALDKPDLVAAVRALAECRPVEANPVICHGDLHPFNLLVQENGVVTVIDWTAAICAAPAFDVAYTSILLANPPLDAPGPIGAVIRWIGGRVARRFIARYSTLTPGRELANLDWYRALHGIRILLETASMATRDDSGAANHPYNVLVPAATAAVSTVTGTLLRNVAAASDQ